MECSFAVTGTLTGMNETSATIIAAPQNFTPSMILQKVVNVANLGAVPSGQDNVHRWADWPVAGAYSCTQTCIPDV